MRSEFVTGAPVSPKNSAIALLYPNLRVETTVTSLGNLGAVRVIGFWCRWGHVVLNGQRQGG